MDKSLAHMANMTDEQLNQMYQNCLRAVLEETRHAAEAAKKIDHIRAETQRRVSMSVAGYSFVETPDRGMLSTLGYRVGNGGEREASRRRLLDFAMSAELPFVSSIRYTLQWGHPSSRARLSKLCRTLEGLATGAEGRPNMALACTHWLEDQDYVMRTWSGRVG
jgi:hypothetical protein